MASTQDVFMEVVHELTAQFGANPTPKQLSEALGVTVKEARQVLAELEVRPPSKASQVNAKAAAKSAAAKSVPVEPLAGEDVGSEEEQHEAPESAPVAAAFPGDLDKPLDEDDATVRHPSPAAGPLEDAEGGESQEEEDDDVQVVAETTAPRLMLPDRQPTSQETPLSGTKRQLSFGADGSSHKRQAPIRSILFAHL